MGLQHRQQAAGQNGEDQLLRAGTVGEGRRQGNQDGRHRRADPVGLAGGGQGLRDPPGQVQKPPIAQALDDPHAQEGGFGNRPRHREQEVDQRPLLLIKVQVGGEAVQHPPSHGKKAVDVHPVVHGVEEGGLGANSQHAEGHQAGKEKTGPEAPVPKKERGFVYRHAAPPLGSTQVKRRRLSSVMAAERLPPCFSTMAAAMARPIPKPLCLSLFRDGSAR